MGAVPEALLESSAVMLAEAATYGRGHIAIGDRRAEAELLVSRGYCTKTMRKIVALRKKKPDDIAEEEAILDLYKTALGMA